MRALALVALTAAAALGGCSDSVDPTLGTDQVYSLYGYLDPTAEQQVVRVVPIAPTLAADTTAAGAIVTSREPATGRTATWRDTTVTFDDGSQGTFYLADYTPTAGTTVELSAEAPDGRVARVDVEVPPLAVPTVGDTGPPGQPAQVYPIEVAGVPRVLGGELRVIVKALPGLDPDRVDTLEVPIERPSISSEGATWTVEVPFLAAVRAFLQEEGLANRGVRLVEAEFAPFVANEAWAVPPGGFDLDAIVEPGTFSNVTGGFGFVGAGYRTAVRWVPSAAVQGLAGFAVPNGLVGQVFINEVGPGYIEFFNPTEEPIVLAGFVAAQGGSDREAEVPAPGLLLPGGFLSVAGPFAADEGLDGRLVDSEGDLIVSSTPIEATVEAWGSFPDGRSFVVPRNDPPFTPDGSLPDIFAGPVASSPGEPNRPARVPAVINEVSVAEGYVEVVVIGSLPSTAFLGTSPDLIVRSPVAAAGQPPFQAPRPNVILGLNRLGGEILLRFGYQVVDVRPYGPQPDGRSAGSLPDGPDGTWTDGLAPTYRSPNASARLGS